MDSVEKEYVYLENIIKLDVIKTRFRKLLIIEEDRTKYSENKR